MLSCLCFWPMLNTTLGVSLITSPQYGDKKELLGKLLVPLVFIRVRQVMTADFFVSLFKRWMQRTLKQAELRQYCANEKELIWKDHINWNW
ncbi:BTE_HP_G0222040.mRNA.1.CDS.1 [Saccharomyces cerevisiae]|nr:BTE_HP_G0222040.mRNA.1.CDS.1 [Saccharomyces cerevisiae]CAI6436324.1 BTE_HP_G0222040.mRNA.1.CDS.1 [Saccharomyces cerevisiae]